MCRLCGDRDCVNGAECHLGRYIYQPAIKAAIGRVQKYDPGCTAKSFGSMQYDFCPEGGRRPSALEGIWAHFRSQGDAGYTCPYCQRTLQGGYHVDHIVPWRAYIQSVLGLAAGERGDIPLFVARVLASDPANLHLVCASCNESKGTMTENDPDFQNWLARRRALGAQ